MRRGDPTARWFASFVTFLSNKEKFINPRSRKDREFVRDLREELTVCVAHSALPYRGGMGFVRRQEFVRKDELFSVSKINFTDRSPHAQAPSVPIRRAGRRARDEVWCLLVRTPWGKICDWGHLQFLCGTPFAPKVRA